MKTFLKTACVALCVFLSACSTKEMVKVQNNIESDSRANATRLHQIHETQEGYYQEVDGMWLGSKQVDKTLAAEPEFLREEVTYSHQYPVTLAMLAEYLTTTFNANVTVTQDALQAAAEAAYDPVQALARQQAQSATQTLAQPPTTAGAGGTVNVAAGAFVLEYQGTVRGLLDQATARTATAWKVLPNGRLVIFGVDTRTFAIHSLPGTASITSSISNSSTSGAQGGGGGGGAGGVTPGSQQTAQGGQTTTVTTQVENIKDAGEVVKSMLSAKGKVAVSTSTITVTDTPAVLDRVRQYVDQLNARLTRQVVVEVRVYSVALSRTENYGIDWQMVWQNIAGRYQIVTGASPDVNADAAHLNFNVIDPTFTYGGSSVLFNALSEQGNVSIKTSAPVTTLSGQPASVQVAQQTTYLAQSQASLVANAGVTVTQTPGSVTTGFTMTLIPIVLDTNQILLEIQGNLSTLDRLRQIGTGNTMIEAPEVNSRQFMNEVRVQSGSTIILSGFEQDSLNSTNKGIGKPTFSILGGSQGSTNGHTVLVVTITPRVTS